ncbi:MAG: thioredoxin family protein [Bacteroidia bacterium]
MSRIIILSISFLFCLPSFGQINFYEGSVSEIMAMAKEENRPIFVDVYTTWCGPCKWLSKNHFQDTEVGNFFNKNYLGFKIDAEKGEGVDFAKKYNVRAYPTLLFIDGDGNLLHKAVGAPKDNEALIAIGEKASDPEAQLYSLKRRYEEGEIEPRILRNYALALADAYEDPSKIAEQYFEMTSLDAITNEEEWDFFTKTVRDLQSDLFQQFVKNKDQFIEAHGEKVDQHISSVVDYSINQVVSNKDEAGLEALKGLFREMYENDYKEKIDLLNYRFYFSDPRSRHNYATTYLNNYDVNWQDLNGAAWAYYENVTDKEELRDALSWAQRSVALDANYYNTDTEAHLLYKLRYWKDAKKAAKRAIKVAKAAGEDPAGTVALLKKIKSKR